jgi:hypothetical protein
MLKAKRSAGRFQISSGNAAAQSQSQPTTRDVLLVISSI